MLRFYHRGAVTCLLASVLLAGCAVAPVRPAPSGSAAGGTPDDVQTIATNAPENVDKKVVAAHAHYVQALLYDMDNEPEKALDEYAQAVVNDPSNEHLVLELTRRYLQLKKPDKAVDPLIRATAVPGASGDLFARLALVQFELGENDKAVSAAQTAITRAPGSLAGYENLYLIQLKRGRPLDAKKALDQAAKATGTSGQFLLGLADLYFNLAREAPSEKAAIDPAVLAVVNRAAKIGSPDAVFRMKIADDFNVLGDSTNATRVYLELLKSAENDPAMFDDIRGRLATLYLRGHDSAKAQEQLEALVRDQPANPRLYYLLASLAYDSRKMEQAADYFGKTIILKEDFEEAYYGLAGVQIDLNRQKEAFGTLAKARTRFAANFNLEFLNALACSKDKDFTNAVAHFTAAEALAKDSSASGRLDEFFYFEAGAAYERAGDIKQAEKYFEECLRLKPDSAEALNYLGYMYADRGENLDHARKMIEQAVKLEPDSAAYLDSLGWVLYKLNLPAEALPQEQKAIAHSPQEDPTLYDHLGDIYAAMKQTDKAREAWRKSLALEPSEQIQKKLDSAGGAPGR